MLRSVTSIEGYSLRATDGNIGELRSIHFDDKSWAVRYLVVNVNNYFDPRDVLILPTAAYELSWISHNIMVNLTKKQVNSALPYSADLPVSRQHELLDAKNFKSLYLADPWSGSIFPLWFPNASATQDLLDEVEVGDKDLRCTEQLTGYKVIGKNGNKVGEIKDFIVDDEKWIIEHVIVDTNGIFPFGDVLVSTFHIQGFNVENKEVLIDMDKQELELCPDYDPHQAVNRDYVLKHYDFEGRLVSTSKVNIDEYKQLDEALDT